MNPNFYSSTIYSSQDMEATQVAINRQMDKEDTIYSHTHTHTHTDNRILLGHERWKSAICCSLDGATEYYAQWNGSEIYCMISLICKNKINL